MLGMEPRQQNVRHTPTPALHSQPSLQGNQRWIKYQNKKETGVGGGEYGRGAALLLSFHRDGAQVAQAGLEYLDASACSTCSSQWLSAGITDIYLHT